MADLHLTEDEARTLHRALTETHVPDGEKVRRSLLRSNVIPESDRVTACSALHFAANRTKDLDFGRAAIALSDRIDKL